MVGMGGGGGGGTPLQIGLAFLFYSSLNLFLNFFNKWALSRDGLGFTFPVFYSMFHMLMSVIGSWVLLKIKTPETGMPSWEQFQMYKWEALALSICSAVNIACNNASLMLIGLFVNQVVKALAPLISMCCSFLILKRRYDKTIIATVIIIAISAGFSVPFKDPSFEYVGLALVVVATLASATKPVVGELIMTGSEKPKLPPASLVFYDSGFAFFIMVTLWLSISSERTGSIAYMSEKPSTGVAVILAGSFSAFGYNMSVFYFTLVASALTVMVATNLLKVALIASTAILEGVHDIMNWCGISVFFVFCILYAYLSYAGKKKKAAPAPAAASGAAPAADQKPSSWTNWFGSKEKPAAKPDETTKLVSP